MISIRRSILDRDLAEADRLQQTTEDCYVALIHALEKHAVEVSPDDLTAFRCTLKGVLRELEGPPSEEKFETIAATMEREIGDYNSKISKFHEASKTEVRQIVSLLTDATAALISRNRHYDTEFRAFASELEGTANCEDLHHMRMELSRKVTELRTSIEGMQEDQSAALRPLQMEMAAIEKRLEAAERLASTDPLTDLVNRREAERRAAEIQAAGGALCLMILDLNHFKAINDRFGHSCGDDALRQFARRLRGLVGSNETVCRWGGDEFLILMQCRLAEAMQRSHLLLRSVNGRYALNSNGTKIDLEISVSIGVSQWEHDEPIETAFERADSMLYKVKQQKRNGLGTPLGR